MMGWDQCQDFLASTGHYPLPVVPPRWKDSNAVWPFEHVFEKSLVLTSVSNHSDAGCVRLVSRFLQFIV